MYHPISNTSVYQHTQNMFINFYSEAVHRYYESRRRKLLDKQPARVLIVKETKKAAQTKSYRKQVNCLCIFVLVGVNGCMHVRDVHLQTLYHRLTDHYYVIANDHLIGAVESTVIT